ncbi:U3 small nucleolar ribonucleoprotein protein IMP3-like [Panonychus citri]|uniref:U3 small nucleolar ribonucleoprotein protein IMP3-like n=1 Tax=Panonychus citri TaxID=50023 RepID=UPI002307797E|nr:U3 small nucleolar ribonucleoprotein protein IMP3-like [Panonychus citri]XP_053208049.1 U3 small nucleolar ribonucleoprotein protein IMP3-like [Panonychus citri]
MVRKLKYHERKLLKKVDFINWEGNNVKEITVMRKYHITREEYTRYNKLVQQIRRLTDKIAALPKDEFRVQCSAELTDRLYVAGIIHTKRLKKCAALTVKSFCRRRLPVFMVKSGMFSAPLAVAVRYVKHGHVRVGPNVVKDPAFLVTRVHEDFISWTEKFADKIAEYKDDHDDYID